MNRRIDFYPQILYPLRIEGQMKIFAIKEFKKWSEGADVSDELLCEAVSEIEKGLIDADLGGHIIKKRIATKGRGKSGSVRTILAFSKGERIVFMFGFEKNERANISTKEKKAVQLLGKSLLAFTDEELQSRLKSRAIIEIKKKEK